MDKRFRMKKEEIWIGGVIIFFLIVFVLPAFLIIHGFILLKNELPLLTSIYGNGHAIGLGLCEFVGGIVMAVFWLKSYLASRKEDKFKIDIIDNGMCYEGTILAYSKEKDIDKVPECVIIKCDEQIHILGVNNIQVPDKLPVGSPIKLFIKEHNQETHILVTNYEVDDITFTIDNKLEVPKHIYNRYKKQYNISEQHEEKK